MFTPRMSVLSVSSRETRILVTGGEGILATALRPYFPSATYAPKAQLDVGDAGSVKRFFSGQSFDLVIHAGAVTSNRADPAAYVQTNVVGTALVLQQARKVGARFVYCSTDYVYADTGAPHPETDPLQPVNLYAWSKLGGECVARSYVSSLIVRGSWHGELKLLAASTDGYTGKLPVARAAYFVAALSTSTATGVVNVGGARRSLYEIAVQFNPHCRPIRRAEAQVGYTLPEDTSLDCTRLHTLVGA